jgi:hypothetical protein
MVWWVRIPILTPLGSVRIGILTHRLGANVRPFPRSRIYWTPIAAVLAVSIRVEVMWTI